MSCTTACRWRGGRRPRAAVGVARLGRDRKRRCRAAHQGGPRRQRSRALGAYAFNQGVINGLSGAGAAAAGRNLARQLIPIVAANNFDGVNLDLEGRATGDRSGFVHFVSAFSAALKAKNPSWTLMLNTYPQSAIDPTSFFDVRGWRPSSHGCS